MCKENINFHVIKELKSEIIIGTKTLHALEIILNF
jgi:hypothetical protein